MLRTLVAMSMAQKRGQVKGRKKKKSGVQEGDAMHQTRIHSFHQFTLPFRIDDVVGVLSDKGMHVMDIQNMNMEHGLSYSC
jgi:hypothetical protein